VLSYTDATRSGPMPHRFVTVALFAVAPYAATLCPDSRSEVSKVTRSVLICCTEAANPCRVSGSDSRAVSSSASSAATAVDGVRAPALASE